MRSSIQASAAGLFSTHPGLLSMFTASGLSSRINMPCASKAMMRLQASAQDSSLPQARRPPTVPQRFLMPASSPVPEPFPALRNTVRTLRCSLRPEQTPQIPSRRFPVHRVPYYIRRRLVGRHRPGKYAAGSDVLLRYLYYKRQREWSQCRSQSVWRQGHGRAWLYLRADSHILLYRRHHDDCLLI